MCEGWVLLFKKFTEWEWYKDTNVKVVFIHLLLKASYQDSKWQGNEIKRGQVITSLEHLANETNLTIKQVRLALKKLEKTQEIETKRTNRFTLITIVKYSDYQDREIEKGNQRTNKGQTEGNQRATSKEIKEIKEDKEVVVEDTTATAEIKNNPLYDYRMAEIAEFYNNNINQIAPTTYDLLSSYLEDMDYLLIIEAIKRAVLSNVRQPRYIIAILNAWKNKGFKTLADLDNENKKEEKKETPEERRKRLIKMLRESEEKNKR